MTDTKKKVQLSCGLLQALFWITYCFSFGFLVAYFTSIGYSKSTIGIIVAILAVNAIIAQPVFGYLSDKLVNIKTVVTICVAVSILLVGLLPFFSQSLAVVIIICVLLGWSEYGLASVIDCWCIGIGQESGASFGVGRACGSFAYAVTAAAFGYVFIYVPVAVTFFLHGVAAIGLLLVILKTQGIPPPSKSGDFTKKGHNKGVLKLLLSNRQYIIFILCASMTFIGSSATSSFMINLIEQKGGTTEHLGYALCVQALFEIPAMVLSVKLLKRFNIRFLLFISMCAYVFKFILPAFSSSPWGVIAAMMIQGVSFAVFLPSAMKYLSLISPRGYQSTGTTLAVGVYSGIGNIVGNLVGGIIADSMGVVFIYYLSAGLAAFSALLFILLCHEKTDKINS